MISYTLLRNLFSKSRKRRASAWITLAVICFGLIWHLVMGWPGESGLDEDPVMNEGLVRVTRVVDGDTIEIEGGEMVRYIGVNTPETVKPNSPVECFGREASAFNKRLVENALVRLEKDVSDRDRYGRLLRFVYLEDGTFVNDALVREGYAYASVFPPDVTKAEQFDSAQIQAREARLGLWADDTCGSKK